MRGRGLFLRLWQSFYCYSRIKGQCHSRTRGQCHSRKSANLSDWRDLAKGGLLSGIQAFVFLLSCLGPSPCSQADDFHLPVPGVMVHLSPPLEPPILKGMKVHPDNPFRFDFILDQGDSQNSSVIARSEATKQSLSTVIPAKAGILNQEQLKIESTKLIKYFLASLTIPEKDLWVNLSPYEKDRIIPQSFGQTEMGRDLLAEDYMLKQITASLIYPEDEIGKKFWKRIYEEAAKKFGTTNIPVNTFNKVWIVPEKAVVYENVKAGTAYVVESKLKVMLEQDYLALEKNTSVSLRGTSEASDEAISKRTTNSVEIASPSARNDVNALGSQIVREIVIPALTKEVNEGKNFAQLRQVYNSLILATWYKKKIKDSILAQVYADKNKVKGVEYSFSVIARSKATKQSLSTNDTEAIYHRYLQAFKKGVFNYIKEEPNPMTQETIPRKYFSGGVVFDLAMNSNNTNMKTVLAFTSDLSQIAENPPGSDRNILVNVGVLPSAVQGRVIPSPQSRVALPKERRSAPASDSVLPKIDVSKEKIGFRRVSILRAFHYHTVWNDWTGERVFRSPLTVYDHLILWTLTVLGLTTAFGGGLALPVIGFFQSLSVFFFYCFVSIGSFFLGAFLSGYAFDHWTEVKDAYTVYRNALKFMKNPVNMESDKDLMEKITKFKEETGWNILWTDDPYLLAWPDKAKKQVVMSIGWVVKSDEDRDRRRLAYLVDTLRKVRHGIKAIEGNKKDQAMRSHGNIISLRLGQDSLRGGIDLTIPNMNLQTYNSNGEIKFQLAPAMLARLQNAPGFVPVIISVKPLINLRSFLGVDA